MLEWFNALIEFFGNFVNQLFRLPFFGSVSIGLVLVLILIFAVTLEIFVDRVK